MTIIVSKDGKNTTIPKSNLEREEVYQKDLEMNPAIIPIYEIDEDKKLVILAREFNTISGDIDAVGTDKDGEIYIIETKRSINPDRRQVVSQLLDYGASLRYEMDSSEFIIQLDNKTREKYKQNLKERLQSEFKIDDEETARKIEDNLKKNFTDNQFKFVVLIDKIEPRLKNLIYFINENSDFAIYLVEFEYYKFDDYQITIPKLYGAEIKSRSDKSSGTRRKWDESSFFKDVKEKLDEKQSQSVHKLYEFSKKTADDVPFGSGTDNGSFNPRFLKIGGRSLYTVWSNGNLTLNFPWFPETENGERFCSKFKESMSKINGFIIPQNYRSESYKIPIETWSPIVDDFINAVNDLITA